MPMTEAELLTILKNQEADTIKSDDYVESLNRDLFASYSQDPDGNEIDGRSQVVSSDHYDQVESDQPTLARIFLGSNKVMTFQPFGEADAEECRQKTDYADYLIRGQKDSFKTIHDWIKEPGFSLFSVVKFYPEETEQVEYVAHEDISLEELTVLMEDLEKLPRVLRVEVESQDEEEGVYSVRFRVVREKKKITIANVPNNAFVITRGASSKDDAVMVGDDCTKRKGELIAEGYDKKLVKSLVPKGMTRSQMEARRLEEQGGYDPVTGIHWTNDEVLIQYRYVLVDYDEDGIPERRMIVRCGDTVLSNEPYGIVPYAILSQTLMPHTLIGRSRGQQAARLQKQKTAIERGIMDNIYAVTRPGYAIDDSAGSIDGGRVDLDDMMNQEINRIVRVDGDPMSAIMPLVTPYIGGEALQIVQFLEAKKASSLGTIAGNQGLDSDKFYKETATRFEGVREAGTAKIELVARVYAETGFRQLYEGVIWTAQHYQDEATEIMVLGKPLTVDPRKWKYEHYCQSGVGLGAGDSEETIANLGVQLQTQLMMAQDQRFASLVDAKKIYATLDDISRAIGKPDTSRYFNNPDIPEDQLLAMLEQASMQIQILQQQAQQNPLAEAELIRAQAKMAEIQGKETNSMRQFMIKMAQQDKEFNAKMQLELAKLAQGGNQFAATLAKDLTKIELDSNQNIPGAMI